MTEQKYIESCQVNLFEGVFNQTITFSKGLNIISGENGTGKTQLLKWIKDNKNSVFFKNQQTDRVVVFNPKRNAEKKKIELFAQALTQGGIDKNKVNQTLTSSKFNDASFLSYRSFGELFIISYEELNRKGNITLTDAIKKTKEAFNTILAKVFENYRITAEWNDGNPNIKIQKNNETLVPIEGLSCGESEVLSLIFNIYVNKDVQDVFLI